MTTAVKRENTPNLVVFRALKLGDLLVSVPALRGLRRKFPDHRILLATPEWLRPITNLIGAVDELLPTADLHSPMPMSGRAVDIAVDMHGNGPLSRSRVEALGARLCMVHRTSPKQDGVPWIEDGLHERERWTRLVEAYDVPADPNEIAIDVPHTPSVRHGAVVVHVGAAKRSRHWPVPRFARVARALHNDGLEVLLTGGSDDLVRARAVAELAGLPHSTVLAGRASLGEVAALIAHARLLVSVDTGAAHLASAYRTPSVVIFGPSPASKWGPPPEGPHTVLTEATLRNGDQYAPRPDPALLAVTAEQVTSAARALLYEKLRCEERM